MIVGCSLALVRTWKLLFKEHVYVVYVYVDIYSIQVLYLSIYIVYSGIIKY